MKTSKSTAARVRGGSFATVVMSFVMLAAVGCGEVVSVEDIDTGGGGSNSLMLTWAAPTTNVDGSPLNDLAGYRLYYGTQPGNYSNVLNVGDFTSAQLSDLGSGTWYLAVTAYDTYGNESDFSNEIHHTFL